jgi:CheY-like chemotaxis protein
MHTENICIMVVEDNAILRFCTVTLLKAQGYRILEAGDGMEALELLEQHNDAIHLLVTNYDMPRLNGIELARRVRAKHKKLPVLLVSGYSPEVEQEDDIELLPKPYNDDVFATKIRELLRRAA